MVIWKNEGVLIARPGLWDHATIFYLIIRSDFFFHVAAAAREIIGMGIRSRTSLKFPDWTTATEVSSRTFEFFHLLMELVVQDLKIVACILALCFTLMFRVVCRVE
mmetsp:Transcript_493/g.842  ORF Transcript_493/g.842 Transcript_493/m.842 type:complete len:106 (+) Transcript_493:438-755(+)